jgi:molybdopterin molybdotransferase
MMISFHEALDLLTENAPALSTERCRIEQAAGRVLREQIHADRDFPPFDRVMMDGYAIRSDVLSKCRDFQIAGSAAAGQVTQVMPEQRECCVEVMTGAPLPHGADCVVPVEEVSFAAPNRIHVSASFECAAGKFIHRAGIDAQAGNVLIESGCLLGSKEIGVASACGMGWLEVSRRPVIRVFATGDELVPVDQVPAPHQIRQSNAHAIRGALHRGGYEVSQVGVIRDNIEEAEAILKQELGACDWLILTGAVSKGARDFIPMILGRLGSRKLFHGVLQRPGKPAGCWLGPDGQMIVALPGNPVSALVGLHALVLPALAKADGMTTPRKRRVAVAESVERLDSMTLHLPVSLDDGGRALAEATHNSGDFIGLLRSDGFITLPPREVADTEFSFTPWL